MENALYTKREALRQLTPFSRFLVRLFITTPYFDERHGEWHMQLNYWNPIGWVVILIALFVVAFVGAIFAVGEATEEFGEILRVPKNGRAHSYYHAPPGPRQGTKAERPSYDGPDGADETEPWR